MPPSKEDVSVEIDHSKEKEEMYSTFETDNKTDFQSSYKSSDFFGGVYSNQLIIWSMFLLYSLGLFSCFGLKLVSWFERTGQAGPQTL